MKKILTAVLLIFTFGLGFFGFTYLFSPNQKETKVEAKKSPLVTLKNGTWVMEQDHLSSLTITDSTLTYAYEGALPTGSDHFKYTIIKSKIEEFRNTIRMVNPLDTLQYEILVHNDTLLSLMDYQNGVIDTYVLK